MGKKTKNPNKLHKMTTRSRSKSPTKNPRPITTHRSSDGTFEATGIPNGVDGKPTIVYREKIDGRWVTKTLVIEKS